MGFRLIKDKSKDNADKLEQLRKIQLDTEVMRWANMTNNGEKKEQFIERFASIKAKPKKDKDMEEIVDDLTTEIKKDKKNLIQAQGNIDLDRIMDLLT
ncbi:MAG: hypothetical protein R3B45_09365 [Bdellovibrionota bacterium]